MAVENDDILDPAHRDDGDTGVEHVGAAGLGREEPKKEPEQRDEIKVSDDGNVAEVKGVKYVRQEALVNERKQRQQLAETLASLEPLMPEFDEFLKERQAKQTRPAPPQGQDAAIKDDPEYLTEVASALGFEDPNNPGQPDLRRAQAHLNITRREAQRAARTEVEPVARGSRAEMARVNRERAKQNRFADGQPVAEEKYLDAALATLNDEHLSDPNVANLAQIVAAGLEYLDKRRDGTLSRGGRRTGGGREPMHLEGGTGRLDGDSGEMSALDLAAARARGKSPEQWSKMMKQANKQGGRGGTVLEEV